MKKYKKQICLIAAGCLLGTAAFCGYHIYDHYADEAEQTKEMAFNQGFYNLFLAIMSIGGAIVLWCGVTVVGVTLMTAGSASMFCAALVLLCTAPDKHSAAIKQIFFPALTLIALLVALILFA